jgi:uncharacterized protein (TIGR02284 family)
MDRDDLFATLNELIETSKDGEEGFRAAADNVENAVLRTFFAEKAERCREGAEQLQDIIREMGGSPATSGSMTGALHRFWVNIRGTLSGMDDGATLAECERGEEAAMRAYEGALNQPLPGDVRQIVDRQYAEVKANRERVREMRNATA